MKKQRSCTRVNKNPLTNKSCLVNSEGKIITPQFKTQDYPPRVFGDFVYLTVTSIGEILYHKRQNKVLLMEHDGIKIENFMHLRNNLYLACFHEGKNSFEHLVSGKKSIYRIYNNKGKHLGDVEGNKKVTLILSGGPIPVIKDGKRAIVYNDGNVEFLKRE